MADNSVLLEVALIAFAGTLIAASIGFIGGLITQVVLERRKQQAEKKKKKAEKLEELVASLYEHRDWLWSIKSIKLKRTQEGMYNSLPKIEAIARVYFPQLEEDIENLSGASDRCEDSIYEQPGSEERRATIDRHFDDYIRCLDAILAKIKDASSEFK
jgi:hypothetical protein